MNLNMRHELEPQTRHLAGPPSCFPGASYGGSRARMNDTWLFGTIFNGRTP
jgi:hypothetical protein